MTLDIAIRKAATLKPKPAEDSLGFGRYFTDHVFVMDFAPDHGWHDARIVPNEPLGLEPAAAVLHYAQATRSWFSRKPTASAGCSATAFPISRWRNT